jgi:hypothetical protein
VAVVGPPHRRLPIHRCADGGLNATAVNATQPDLPLNVPANSSPRAKTNSWPAQFLARGRIPTAARVVAHQGCDYVARRAADCQCVFASNCSDEAKLDTVTAQLSARSMLQIRQVARRLLSAPFTLPKKLARPAAQRHRRSTSVWLIKARSSFLSSPQRKYQGKRGHRDHAGAGHAW